jgi:signal transduction histidine kinase
MTTRDPRLHVAESIENAVAELSNALAELDRIPVYDHSVIGLVAHAMNNYLSVSDATLGLIERAIPDPPREVATWFEGLRHLGTLVQHTVDRLLCATPPEEFPLKAEYVNVSRLMERACEYYRPRARDKQLEIVCRTVDEVPPAWADRVAVAIVADNLLANAVRFSCPGSQILVQVMPGPGGVVCCVRDHGRGLTFLEQARLFEHAAAPGPLPTDVDAATGHGLAIAKQLVDRMSGRLWAESEPGHGASFFFRLQYHQQLRRPSFWSSLSRPVQRAPPSKEARWTPARAA